MTGSIAFRLAILALSLAAATPAVAAEPPLVIPVYLEETAGAGIDSAYAGDWQYMVGGGVATFDCNEDGYADMLLAGGEKPAKFYRNVSTQAGPLRFVAEASGLEVDRVTGAYPLDIDSDGIADLMLLRVGENIVMRGRGGCRFERANEDWGFDGGDAWSTALAATFERGATWPTIAIGNYIDRNEDMFPWGSCTDNWLHRPQDAAGDKRRFAAPVPLKPSFCPLSMLFTDWNRSGTPALRISNDREYYKGGQEQLWHVLPGQPPALFTTEEGWRPLRIWGMGIAGHDIDLDGYPEYFLTSMADNKLQTLTAVPKDGAPQPVYSDVAFAKGVTAHRPYAGGEVRPSTAWHAQFEDVNNDSRIDLFVAKGNVADMPDFARKDPNNLLLQAEDGTFKEAGDKAGVTNFATTRGAALADFNLDGLLDLVVVNRWETAKIWRNTTPAAGHWIGIELRQAGINRDAIGAWLEVRLDARVLRREITVGGGHASGQRGWQHVGLGQTANADLRVIWPDGEASDWQTLAGNAFYTLERGKPAAVWTPK